jgi:hypothetical protein
MHARHGSEATRHKAARVATIGLAMALGGCVAYYPATPYSAPYAAPSTFDRAFDAAIGAITDQGLSISHQDRASGNIVGARGALSVTATVRPQADGTTRVEFNTRGDQGADAGLSQRVLAAYNARMGR